MIAPASRTMTFMGFRPTGDFGPLTGYTSKRGKHIWFLKSPPKSPPTGWQIHQRNTFRITAILWRSLSSSERKDWLRAARLAHLKITGYNLFVWYQAKRDRKVIATVEKQSGISLVTF